MPNWTQEVGNAASFVLQKWVYEHRSFTVSVFRQGMEALLSRAVLEYDVFQFLKTWHADLKGHEIYEVAEGVKGEVAYLPRDSDGAQHFILPETGVNLAALEKDLILQAMRRTNNNQTAAGRLLGISRYAMHHRLKKLGVLK